MSSGQTQNLAYQRPQRNGEDRNSVSQSRDQILIAAADCFKENGFAATSIDDVAHMLGATKGMIYHHFRSKMDLFFAVYRRGMELNFNATEPQAQVGGSPLERLACMGMAHAVALMAHQPFQRVLAQGVAMHQTGSTTAAQRDTLSDLIRTRDTYEALFRKTIEAAADEMNVDIGDPSLASKSFLAVLNSTVFWYSPRRKNARAEQMSLAEELVNYALRGLGMTPPQGALEEWKQSNE
ncbi:MAG: TetR/AcrR family transcriptional regulator [Rhizobiaceae bacterium]